MTHAGVTQAEKREAEHLLTCPERELARLPDGERERLSKLLVRYRDKMMTAVQWNELWTVHDRLVALGWPPATAGFFGT